jgi:predicted ABC-type ATPase
MCDKILIYDNSGTSALIFRKENAYAEIFPNILWPEPTLRRLFAL